MDRIFGLREKQTSSTYGDFIPFGVEGKHAIVGDGLSLEQELQIGGGGQVHIIEDSNGDVTVNQSDIDEAKAQYKKVDTIITTTKPDATQYPIDAELPTGINLADATYIIQNTERGTRKIKKVTVITATDDIYSIILEKEGDD